MTIVLRETKGMPLTAAEVDGNFKELLVRITQLEALNPVQEKLSQIQQDGDELILTGSLGTVLGRVQVPTVRMMPRGPWKVATAYQLNDLITQNNACYLCTKSHTAQNFTAEQEQWLKLFNLLAVPQAATSTDRQNVIELPVLSRDHSLPPRVGRLALYMADNHLDLLVGDVNCWRKISASEELKISQSS